MRKLFERAREKDNGTAMILVAMSMVLLLGMAAFGTDLAWFYLNASRVQRAADAAALGGVVWLPDDTVTANSTALATALQNGYERRRRRRGGQLRCSDRRAEPARGICPRRGADLLPRRPRLRRYDHRAVGGGRVHTAVEIGESSRTVRQQLRSRLRPAATGQANFWANIHGWFTDTGMGDAYTSHCVGSSDVPACTANPIARPGGYLYGIERGTGDFTIEGIDLRFFNTSGGNPTSDTIRTGDRGCEDWTPSTSRRPVGRPWWSGSTPRTPHHSTSPTMPPLCARQPSAPPGRCCRQLPTAGHAAFGAAGGARRPVGLSRGTGIYVLQIAVQDPGNTVDRAGLNRYSVRANNNGAKLFALGDFSIYNNASGTTTSFYLAEVPTYYHGKTFVVELYDAGESANNGTLAVVDPSTNVFNDGECRIYSRNNPNVAWNLQQTIPSGSNCQETVTPGEYNGRWLKFEMDLPAAYSCSNCWWKMSYAYPSAVNDTTTWRAYMIGNPIHLID